MSVRRVVGFFLGASLWIAILSLGVFHGLHAEASKHLYDDRASDWEEAYHKQVSYTKYLQDQNRILKREAEILRSRLAELNQ